MFGMSPNSYIEELFRRKITTIGRLVDIASMEEGGIMTTSLNKNDCAIIISYSGNNRYREPMQFIEILKKIMFQ